MGLLGGQVLSGRVAVYGLPLRFGVQAHVLRTGIDNASAVASSAHRDSGGPWGRRNREWWGLPKVQWLAKTATGRDGRRPAIGQSPTASRFGEAGRFWLHRPDRSSKITATGKQAALGVVWVLRRTSPCRANRILVLREESLEPRGRGARITGGCRAGLTALGLGILGGGKTAGHSQLRTCGNLQDLRLHICSAGRLSR